MSVSLTINGISYNYPETGDENWGADATDWAIGVTNGMLQKAGGLFQLLAEVDFGTTYGLKSVYYKTRTSNVAAAGQFRLAKTDNISWRNNANSADLALAIDGSDNLTFNGAVIPSGFDISDTSTIDLSFVSNVLSADIVTDSITNSLINSAAAIAYSKLNLTGSIVNADISGSAAIAYSKLNLTGDIVNADISTSAAIAYSKLNLTGDIVNADISASAAIVYSKLNLSNSIVNADINTAAAIAYSKLNLTGSIVNADINASAAIAYSKLNLTGSIVNADINASAAIAFSKLAALTSGNILVGNGSNVATSVAMSGDVTMDNTGATSIGANKVTNSMLAQIATARFKGRTTAGTGNVEDLTTTQATALLNALVGDSGSGGTKGLAPAPAAGDTAAGKFLRADAQWAVPAGAGNVTGPGSSTDNGFVKWNGTSGTVIKDSAATISNSDVNSSAAIALSKLAATTVSRALVSDSSGFVSAATTTSTEIGYVNGVTSAIQTQINGKLPTTITTTGDMIYSSSGSTASRLAIGTNGHVLNTLSGIPTWGYYTKTRAVTGTDTATTSDRVLLVDATSASFTETLPAASGNAGLAYYFIKTNSTNVVTIDANASETIGGALTIKMATLNDSLQIVCDGSNWQVLSYQINNVAIYSSNAGFSVANATNVVVNFANSVSDPLSQVTTGASWVFTAQYPGNYNLAAVVNFNNSTWADGKICVVDILKNGSIWKETETPNYTTSSLPLSWAINDVGIPLAINDTLAVRLFQNNGSQTLITDNNLNRISIRRSN